MSATVGSNLGPWHLGHLRAMLLTDVAAVLLLTGAWAGSHRASTLNSQIAWMNLAVLALVLYAVSNGMFLLVGRKLAGARRRTLLPDLVSDGRPQAAERSDGDSWVWLPGTRRGHRAGCALIVGKPTVVVDYAQIRAESLQRCEVCGG